MAPAPGGEGTALREPGRAALGTSLGTLSGAGGEVPVCPAGVDEGQVARLNPATLLSLGVGGESGTSAWDSGMPRSQSRPSNVDQQITACQRCLGPQLDAQAWASG